MSATIKAAITALKSKIAAAYSAISAKGGTLPATQDSDNLASAIDTIPSPPAIKQKIFIDSPTCILNGDEIVDLSGIEMFRPSSSTANPNILFGNTAIKELILGDNTMSYQTQFVQFAQGASNLESIKGRMVCSITRAMYAFALCPKIHDVDMTGITWNNPSGAGEVSQIFNTGGTSIVDIVGGLSEQEVVAGQIGVWNNVQSSFAINTLTNLNKASLLAVLYGLADLTELEKSATLTCGSTILNKFSTAEKQIATDKGWTLA